MAARNDETWLFVVEWFDPMPRLKRMYLLKYFVQQHQVEMVDIKSKKIFLKKSPCTGETSPEDFGIGKKILLFSRDLDIVDYGDSATRNKLELQQQQAILILSHSVYEKWGIILDQINQILTVLALKSVFPPQDIADRILQITKPDSENNGNRFSRKSSTILSEGVCFCLLLTGKDAINTVSDFASQNNLFGSDSVFIGYNGSQVRELADLIFDSRVSNSNGDSSRMMPVSVSLDNCTCCVVKPHSFKAKDTGRILDLIIARGYEVSAILSLNFDKTQAEEFLDVYKGVVPDFNDQVLQLSSGTCVAFEVRAVDAVEVFRETAGPWDVSMAKELRPKSIRGMFGESNVRSAVHCTDLMQDGVTDCEYCFRYMN